jgi:hypothetical protein
MKNIKRFRMLVALSGVIAPLWVQAQTTIFSDTFSTSTTNQPSIPQPGGAGPNTSTSYDIASVKNGVLNTFIQPSDLRLTLAAGTTSGFLEAQALFTTNPFELNAVGDYIDISFVFTNTTGTTLSAGGSSALWLGLYSSGDTPGTETNIPVSGGGLANAGLNVASSFVSGNCQPWAGYLAQMTPNGGSMETRPTQLVSGNNSVNQELLAPSGITGDFQHPLGTGLQGVAGTTPPATGSLATNVPYTMDMRITVIGNALMVVSNSFYQGNSTAGTLLFSQIGTATTTNNTFLTSTFDGLAIGVRSSGVTANPLMDVSSISIVGQSTPVSGPPNILSQPSAVQVATNGMCLFSVSATGDQIAYQWVRNGTPLSNSGNISIVTGGGGFSSTLYVSNCTTADQFSGNNGYYCIVSGAGGFSVDTATNALTLQPATNLIWSVALSTWDVHNTAAWDDTNGNPQVFDYGDPVEFNDSSAGQVNLSGNFLSASSILIDSTSSSYSFQGGGSIAGPGTCIISGAGRYSLSTLNTYTGGTIISNAAANIFLQNYSFFGTGPLTLAGGGQIEIDQAGGVTTGFQGTTIIASNFTMAVDFDTAFGAVFLGDISGTAGQTLSFVPGPNNQETNSNYRIRTEGVATTCNANLNFNDTSGNSGVLMIFAPSQSSGTQTYNGIISGNGAFFNDGKGLVVLNGQNTYSGGSVLAEATTAVGVSSIVNSGTIISGPLGIGPLNLVPDSSSLTASAVIEASVNNITVANPLEYPSGTNNYELEVGGANNITFSGAFTLNGNDGLTSATFPNRMLQVTNTGITTFSGVISDGGLGGNDYGLTVTGNGTNFVGPLILTTTETYSGPTTNAGDVLLINGQVGPGEVFVTNSGTLGGIGTITGPVVVSTNSILTAGTATTPSVMAIGTLTINNNLTFNGGARALVKVNGANSDEFTVSGALTYNGTLIATNTGSALSTSATFQIFPAGGSGNFTTISGTPGPNEAWTFTPATGILGVISTLAPTFTIPPAVTNITFLSGTNVTLSGTNGQSGDTYYLLTSTNLATPLSQWKPVSTNIAAGNGFSFTATNVASLKDAHRFFIFANTNF